MSQFLEKNLLGGKLKSIETMDYGLCVMSELNYIIKNCLFCPKKFC